MDSHINIFHRTIIFMITALGIGLILTGSGPAAYAQGVVSLDHPYGLMRLRVEYPNTLSRVDNDNVTHYWQSPAGRFQLITGARSPIGGDPTRAGDENRPVASVEHTVTGPEEEYVYDRFTSKLTVYVDGETYDIHRPAATAEETTGTAANFWPVPPQTGSRDVYAVGVIPMDNENPNEATEWIEVEHRYTLIHDTVRLEYVVSNETSTTHDISVRPAIDAWFGQWEQDGGTIVLPDGQQIVAEKQIPDSEIVTVPDTWVAYDDINDPTMMLSGTPGGSEVNDPANASEAAGKPNEIAWGRRRSITRTGQWDFTANEGVGLENEDWGYAVKWDPAPLEPGRSRRYVTYFGLGAASVDYEPPYALAAYTPHRLRVKDGDDPATAAVEEYYLTDQQGRSPFEVDVYADNFSPSPIAEASVRVDLPTGFQLSPDTQSRTKSLGTIGRNELENVSWTIRASATRPGTRSVEFIGPFGKNVLSDITVPVIPALTPQPSELGLEMISIPYEFDNNSVEHVFTKFGSMHPGAGNGLVRYNPQEQRYRWYPHNFTDTITPGHGYWFLNENRDTVYFPDDLSPVSTQLEYLLDVERGWNQIGTPFTAVTYFNRLIVTDNNGTDWGMSEAIDRLLILGTVFEWDAQDEEYEWETEVSDVALAPYTGYWVYCNQDLILRFVPESLYGAGGSTTEFGHQPQTTANTWECPIVLSSGPTMQASCRFGVAEGAAPGLDTCDVLAPPAAVTTGTTPDCRMIGSPDGHQYMADIRPDNADKKEWKMAVTTEAEQETITVRWPKLANLPNDLVATFKDETAGETRYMRTTTGYTYKTKENPGTRNFTITVHPRNKSPLVVRSANAVQTSNGVSIVYTLSQSAQVDLEIRNISGILISCVATGQQADSGINTTTWNGRNSHGAPMPAGRYLLKITAHSPETGQQHSRVCSFRMNR